MWTLKLPTKEDLDKISMEYCGDDCVEKAMQDVIALIIKLNKGGSAMPSESEVREAVEFFKDAELNGRIIAEKTNVLLSLAEAWLGRKIPSKATPFTPDYYASPKEQEIHNKAWNSAIDACQLASVVSEESIAEIINKEPLPQEGKKWEYSKKLAHAIATAINGEKGNE